MAFPTLTFCFTHRADRTLRAYIEVDPAESLDPRNPAMVRLVAEDRLAEHFGPSDNWTHESSRIDVRRITGWYRGEYPKAPDAFYLRADGHTHGWFDVATRTITQVG